MNQRGWMRQWRKANKHLAKQTGAWRAGKVTARELERAARRVSVTTGKAFGGKR